MLKGIDFNRTFVEDLKLKTIKTSESTTLKHFLELIKEKNQLDSKIDLRLWLP
jgi:hypothetical protein